MVLESRRTIICKSGSGSNQHIKTKSIDHCTESITRSKRVHQRRRMLSQQGFTNEDNTIIQADLIEISLVGDPAPHQNKSSSNSEVELVEQLIESAKSGDLRLFQRACTRMIQFHLRLDSPGYMGWTAAHWAAREGHVHLLEHLTTCHANLNAVDRKGDTLLHKAAANGQHLTCKWLLARGFNANTRNNNNRSPLDLAREHLAISKRSNAAILCEMILSSQ